jgi:hypothetical protein
LVTSFIALRRHSLPLWAVATLLAASSFFVSSVGRRRPNALSGMVALWAPIGDAIGRRLAVLALNVVYFTVLSPIAMLRRKRGSIVSLPPGEGPLPSYWRAPDAPRGAPDRMF